MLEDKDIQQGYERIYATYFRMQDAARVLQRYGKAAQTHCARQDEVQLSLAADAKKVCELWTNYGLIMD